MAEKKFYCTACGKEHEGDVVASGVAECRVCFRVHCQECLNEDGICVPCSELEDTKED